MTMPETYMAIEAATEREELRQKEQVTLAWRTANFMRAKRLPSLQFVLAGSKRRPEPTPQELARRREEHQAMTRQVDAATMNILGRRLERAKAERRIN